MKSGMGINKKCNKLFSYNDKEAIFSYALENEKIILDVGIDIIKSWIDYLYPFQISFGF